MCRGSPTANEIMPVLKRDFAQLGKVRQKVFDFGAAVLDRIQPMRARLGGGLFIFHLMV